jgi:hypothetical protein
MHGQQNIKLRDKVLFKLNNSKILNAIVVCVAFQFYPLTTWSSQAYSAPIENRNFTDVFLMPVKSFAADLGIFKSYATVRDHTCPNVQWFSCMIFWPLVVNYTLISNTNSTVIKPEKCIFVVNKTYLVTVYIFKHSLTIKLTNLSSLEIFY